MLYVVDDVPIITWHTLTDFAPKSPSTTNFGNEAICVTLFAILPNLSNSACAFNGSVAQSETEPDEAGAFAFKANKLTFLASSIMLFKANWTVFASVPFDPFEIILFPSNEGFAVSCFSPLFEAITFSFASVDSASEIKFSNLLCSFLSLANRTSL